MKPLSVVLYGLEDQDSQLFRKTFNALNDSVKQRWKWIADNADTDADLIIVDIDSIHGHIDWLKATGAGQRTAVYTAARHAKESDLTLSKPLLADDFVAVLTTVAGEHAGHNGAAADDVEVVLDQAPTKSTASAAARIDENASPAASAAQVQTAAASVHALQRRVAKPLRKSTPVVARVEKPAPVATPKRVPSALSESESESIRELEPQPATIGEWLRIGKFEQPTRISGSQESWVLDPDRKAYHGPAALKPLLELLKQPMDRLERVDVVALESARKQASQPLARLRWVAGLGVSPGKLLAELDGATSFKLARWPQIEREYPRHFRIATAMMKQAGSVDEINAASGAPRNDVVDFINAYHTLGYIVHQGDSEETVDAPRDGMMSRIRKPFGR